MLYLTVHPSLGAETHSESSRSQFQGSGWSREYQLGMLSQAVMEYERRGTWRELRVSGNKPKPRYAHALTAVDGRVILFGGQTSTGMLPLDTCSHTFRTSRQLHWPALHRLLMFPEHEEYRRSCKKD